MNMKDHILAALEEQFVRWETLLANLPAEQIEAASFDHSWSIKDLIAHLWAWQQVSIARLKAGVLDQKPSLPAWVEEFGADWEEDADRANALLYDTYHGKSWSEVYSYWQAGFSRLLQLGELVPEKDLLDGDRYPWLEGYSLAFILVASYDHHQEHLEKLRAWLEEHGSQHGL
jgi:hypothetical protein